MDRAKTAVVLGAGGLGGAALLTLADGGAARIIVVDGADVREADLLLAPLVAEADLTARRALAAAAALRARFPLCQVEAVDAEPDAGTLAALLSAAGVLVDAATDPGAKLLANDAALRAGVPLVHAAVLRATAQLLTVRPGGAGGCLLCLFEAVPAPGAIPSFAEAGVLGPLAALAGALAGAEALRLLAGEEGAYEGHLMSLEATTATSRMVEVRRRPGCPSCGIGPFAEEGS